MTAICAPLSEDIKVHPVKIEAGRVLIELA